MLFIYCMLFVFALSFMIRQAARDAVADERKKVDQYRKIRDRISYEALVAEERRVEGLRAEGRRIAEESIHDGRR